MAHPLYYFSILSLCIHPDSTTLSHMFHRKAHKVVNFVIGICIIGIVLLFLKSPVSESLDAPFPSFDESKWRLIDEQSFPTSNDLNAPEGNTLKPPDWRTDMAEWRFNVAGSSENVSITGEEVVKSVQFLNENYNILNIAKFGSLDTVKTVVVIQVHNRIAYLRYLIESLRHTDGISDTLLVFSHDISVSAINELIRNITFARVYQIFYPFNMQLFPNVFPGQDLNDCPEKMGKEKAKEVKCLNWNTPDKYGNFRKAALTQIKHHWWWKMNYVFDGIIDRFNLSDAYVLLLEEDHYVAPDALYMLNLTITNKETLCSACEIISLGTYLKNYRNYGRDISHLGAHPFFSSKHNMGMALNKNTWLKLKNCSEMFCTYDDYNWDWSLMHINVKCFPQRFKALFTKSPRILHIGDCGVHTHRCDANKAYLSAKDLLQKHEKSLFPKQITVTDVSRRSLKPSKENGGWGDTRDHDLCRLNTSPLKWREQDYSVLSNLISSSVIVPNIPT